MQKRNWLLIFSLVFYFFIFNTSVLAYRLVIQTYNLTDSGSAKGLMIVRETNKGKKGYGIFVGAEYAIDKELSDLFDKVNGKIIYDNDKLYEELVDLSECEDKLGIYRVFRSLLSQ